MKKLYISFGVLLSVILLLFLYIALVYFLGGKGYGLRYFQAKNSEVLSVEFTQKPMEDINGLVAQGIVFKTVVKINSPLILKDLETSQDPIRLRPSFVKVFTPTGDRLHPFLNLYDDMYVEKVSEGVYRFTRERDCDNNYYPENCQKWADKITNPENQYEVTLSYRQRSFKNYFIDSSQ